MATATQVVAKRTVYYCRMSKIYERYFFRLTKQKPGEKFESFLLRLRFQSAKCQFKDTEEQLIDQIVEKCNSVELRQKILAAGDSINLTGIIAAANALETVNPKLEDSAELKPNTLDTIHIKFSKDVENLLNRLAVDTRTHVNIPCGNESISSKLSNETAITKPTSDLTVKIGETSISGSTSTLPRQSIEQTKTETPLREFRSIDHDYTSVTKSTQPEDHSKKKKKKKVYKCKFCNYSTMRRTVLLEHRRRRHKTLRCTLCDFTTIASEEMKKHKATHPKEKIKMLCSTCGFICASAATLTMHMRTHTGVKPYKCSKCNYASVQKGSLTNHMRTHTREKRFVCSVCGSRLAHRPALVLHMKTHTGEKPYKCSICDYACIQKCSLTRHMRQHTGEQPFKCSICNFACKQSCLLTAHMRQHSGEKPFQCSQCNYACRQKASLVVHMRTHTGERPFKCTVCNDDFPTRNRLIVHTRLHTGENPFKCSICHFPCTQRSTLKQHMKSAVNATMLVDKNLIL